MYIFKISLKLLLIETDIFNTVSSLFRTKLDQSLHSMNWRVI